jgi:hypothetical protein
MSEVLIVSLPDVPELLDWDRIEAAEGQQYVCEAFITDEDDRAEAITNRLMSEQAVMVSFPVGYPGRVIRAEVRHVVQEFSTTSELLVMKIILDQGQFDELLALNRRDTAGSLVGNDSDCLGR